MHEWYTNSISHTYTHTSLLTRYNYRAVIYGWDHKCEMSDGWMIQMGVHRLPRGRNQPFYNVLVEDGSNRYAAEG